MALPITTGSDYRDLYTVKDSSGTVVDLSGATAIDARIISHDHKKQLADSSALTLGDAENVLTAGIIAVTFTAAITAELLDYDPVIRNGAGAAIVQLSVTEGGLISTYQFVASVVRGHFN